MIVGVGWALGGLALAISCAVLGAGGCSSPAAGTRASDAGVDVQPDSAGDLRPNDASCPADAMGGGDCPINFCGQLLAASALPPNEFSQSGADSICNGGRVCVVGPVLANGTGFQLSCVAPVPSALAFGAACSPNAADGMRCANDALCITAPGSPSAPFCTTLCRSDADCPAEARCLEYPTASLPDGSQPMIGECTPEAKLGGTPCAREADCLANEGCVPYGSRTDLDVCKSTGGTKAVGAACAGSADCRSAACYDRNFELNGTVNRTFCSAPCSKNSDCGADQLCVRLVLNDDGTPSNPTDDVVEGYCQSLHAATGGCTQDSDCLAVDGESDACDTAYGLCYRREAVPGSACGMSTDCMPGGVCSTGTRFVGGYCQIYGCDPTATAGVDFCPGPRSACVERGPDSPLHACYESCDVTAPNSCSRASENYGCGPVTTGGPDVCLENGGS
jgi:hypothetical protein